MKREALILTAFCLISKGVETVFVKMQFFSIASYTPWTNDNSHISIAEQIE